MMKKIDGRKAVVTTTGALFSGYSEFANYYDYPESAGQYPETNPNRSLKNGDVVTLIVSGKHLNLLYSYPLWIVEAENGEKYIIGERGLNILENETEGDESMVIDGVKYREVKRKAAVGELIKTTAIGGAYNKIPIGKALVVRYVFNDGSGVDTENWSYEHGEYVVLEPIKEQSDAFITELTRKVNELSAELGEVKRQLAELVAQPTADPQKTRDWAVEKAKAEVAELIRIGTDRSARLPDASPFRSSFYEVQFEVNRDKRTVVALIKGIRIRHVKGRGIAKCAPGDCFNVHIGKAIALYRALGLRVPDEFVYAPQPTDIRVGDFVCNWEGRTLPVRTRGSIEYGLTVDYVVGCGYKVIDDSREDCGVSA